MAPSGRDDVIGTGKDRRVQRRTALLNGRSYSMFATPSAS